MHKENYALKGLRKGLRLLAYGTALAVGATVLQWLDYRHSLRALPTDMLVAMIAVLFGCLGVWAGHQLARRKAHDAVVVPGAPPGATPQSKQAREAIGITARQYEVLVLLAAGCTNDEIARQLHLSTNTVKSHIQGLYGKLQVSRRTQAVQRAREVGLLA